MKDSKQIKEQDQRLLLVVKQNYWQRMSASEQGLWAAAWGQTQTYGRITNKTIKRLEEILTQFANPVKM